MHAQVRGAGRRLGGWSGYWRWVRGPDTGRLWIRRGRCSRCLRSHALLPDFLLERRLDAVEVIGHALALGIVGGLGVRSVADRVEVPMTTARGWRRWWPWPCSWIQPRCSWQVRAKPPSSKRSGLPGSELEPASVNAGLRCGVSGVSSAAATRWGPTEARPRRRQAEQVG